MLFYHILTRVDASFAVIDEGRIRRPADLRVYSSKESATDISIFGMWILNYNYPSYFGVGLNRRQLRRMLKSYGYSDKAVKAILELYK